MAMTKTTLGNGWTAILSGTAVDTLVVIQGGAARLCTGSASATTDLGYDVGNGYQIIVPAGVDLYGVSTGGASVAVAGPFGV